MTCVWNRNLHRQRVDRSNKYHQKQFLNPDHWTQNPKSRECNEHTWFVVRLRIGPVTACCKKLTDFWKTIAIWSCDPNMCIPRLTLKEQKAFTFEAPHTQKAHAATSKNMHQLVGSTTLNPSSKNWNSFTLMLSDPIYMKKLWILNHSMIVFISSTSPS